jgi:hypothetical protein
MRSNSLNKHEKTILIAEAKETSGEKGKIMLPEVIRPEVNFLVLPFFALWDNDVKKKSEISYRTTVIRDTQRLEISWTVSSTYRYGYPGPFDRDVHKAVEQIISELPLPIQNPIPLGSLYSLCKRMGIDKLGGEQYRKIKEAFKRIIATTIESEGTFYIKQKKAWVEDIFHLYDRVIFKGEDLQNGGIADNNYLYLNSWYLDNINANYTKPIDWNYYRSLETPIAQRLYELLSVKFFGLIMRKGKFIAYKYSTICDLLPTNRQKYLSFAKRSLEQAHKKLEETAFLEHWDWAELPQREKDWLIKYYPGKRAKAEIERYKAGDQLEFELLSRSEEEVTEEEKVLSAEEFGIVEQLTQRGMTQTTASELTRTHPTSQIQEQIAIFDWLMENKNSLVKKNPAGFLRKSIEENYQPPEEYSSRHEREAKRLEEEKIKAQKQAEEEKIERELARIKARKESLSHEERAKLREKAVDEIRNSGQFKQEFITERLIEVKENEILREQVGLKTDDLE